MNQEPRGCWNCPRLVNERARRFRFQFVRDAPHQPARIQQVLRAKMPLRPPASSFEFDSKEIADLAKHTVLYFSHQLAIWVADTEGRPEGNRAIHLETGA